MTTEKLRMTAVATRNFSARAEEDMLRPMGLVVSRLQERPSSKGRQLILLTFVIMRTGRLDLAARACITMWTDTYCNCI